MTETIHKTFETERLILKPSSEEDAAFVLELLNTPKWLKFIGDRNVRTVEQAKAYIRSRMISGQTRQAYVSFTIIRKADQAKIGTCGLYDREGVEGIDIGFSFLHSMKSKAMVLRRPAN